MSIEGFRGTKGVAAPPYTSPPYVWANNAAAGVIPYGTTPFLDYEIYSNNTTQPCRQGAVRIQCLRYTAITTWDGNADCALRVYTLNAIAQTAGHRIVGMELQARSNYTITQVTGISSNSRVSSGATCTTMYGLNHTCEIYGTVSTTLYGMYMDMRNEGAAPTTSAAIFIYNSNASLGTAIGSAIRISKGTVNTGFDYAIDATGADCINTAAFAFYDDGDVCNDTASTGSFASAAGYITVVIGSATRYIHLSSAKPT